MLIEPGSAEAKHATSLEQLRAGMIVQQAVHDANGNVLLPSGSALTDASIAALKRRGIAAIICAAAEPTPSTPSTPSEIAERLQHLFRKTQDNPAAAALHAAVLDYRSQI